MTVDCGSILVVDTDEDFVVFASSLLKHGGLSVDARADSEDALTAARDVRPALALIEVELPGFTGYQLCRGLREHYGEDLPIVLMSATRIDVVDRVAAFMIGADDYFVKPVAGQELIARVMRLLDRAAVLARASSGRRIDPATLGLSPREIDVLRLLSNGLRNAAIAQALCISPKTVASHIHGIFAKLGVHTRAEAIAFAYREGLVEAPLVGAPASP